MFRLFLTNGKNVGTTNRRKSNNADRQETIIFVAIVFGVGLAIAVITAFKLKTKLKVRSSRMNN